MQHVLSFSALLPHVTNASDFVSWLQSNGEQLIAAAQNLGGPDWARRAKAIVGTATTGRDLGSRRSELHALRRLLRLDLADKLASDEGLRFASLHPDDPRADEARICFEALDRGIRAIEALRMAGHSNVGRIAK